MKLFDTDVQELKYKVLREVATCAFEDNLEKGLLDIPEKIVPGPEPLMRCCIYKERAIVNERIKLATGGDKQNPNVVEVIKMACDECPVDGIRVTQSCRGCIAHRCMNACPKDAISIVNHRAVIDKSKCIECGKCMAACPYHAIEKSTRPCENACKVDAIHMDEYKRADIDNDKCISCGACVYQCPFGAIQDKSFLLDAVRLIKGSQGNTKYKVYAVVAPSISGQFRQAKVEQVVAGIKKLGFYSVIEAALGADMVAYKEAQELYEKKFLTSSCCPAFVKFIQVNYPDMVPHISHNLSPMEEIASFIKKRDADCKIVFIGPCVAKKMEYRLEKVRGLIDCVLTFEELQALFDSRELDLASLPEEKLDNASYYGRIFARSGGLSEAAGQAVKELGIAPEDFQVQPAVCNGIAECKIALLKASKGILKENFIEGMACESGCIGGAGCLTHGPKNKTEVDNYGKQAMEKTITDAITVLNI